MVKTVLGSEELTKLLKEDVQQIVQRMKSMREKLVKGLKEKVPSRDFSHVADQKGMFCFTGLKECEVKRLTEDYHIYMTKSGRISVAGLNDSNINYVIDSFSKVCSQ